VRLAAFSFALNHVERMGACPPCACIGAVGSLHRRNRWVGGEEAVGEEEKVVLEERVHLGAPGGSVDVVESISNNSSVVPIPIPVGL
jgi:hypothetical protein